ncbi:hypothetical protein [Streptomyces sp. CC219B]|uniref:hypothetical protein n=1 Tax=Streptomyces sp. CC219B TaxID=3044574 RepID=UPI0024A96FD6|nr:hypothetical protein [Streptomyces sp. CC219B]
MTVGIIHTILGWVVGVFAPGTSRRRAGARPVSETREEGSETPDVLPQLPAHRSPYGLHAPLDGYAVVMVRPYVLAAERERSRRGAEQWRRRLALVLAADFGIDLDRHIVGAEGVSA